MREDVKKMEIAPAGSLPRIDARNPRKEALVYRAHQSIIFDVRRKVKMPVWCLDAPLFWSFAAVSR